MKHVIYLLLPCLLLVSCSPENKDGEFTRNINALLATPEVALGSDLKQMAAYEMGRYYASQLIYDSLPQAQECVGTVVRYIWLPLSKTKLHDRIYAFFRRKGLADRISGDSYIVYIYCNHRLGRISLRIFTATGDIGLFYAALGQDMNEHPGGYVCNSGGIYYATGNSLKNLPCVDIAIMNKEGYEFCSNDWWRK